MQYKILVAGHNRKVTAFVDVAGAETMVKVWVQKHGEDIQAMSYLDPSVLMTASYDGDIIVWSTETSQPACRFGSTSINHYWALLRIRSCLHYKERNSYRS